MHGRPDDDRPEIVEIPVVSGETEPSELLESHDGPAMRPSLGTAVVVAAGLVAVIIVGSVAIQIWSDGDDGDDGDRAPTVDDDLPATIDVPDTLPPLAEERTAPLDPLARRPPLELRVVDADIDVDLGVGVERIDDAVDLMSETFVESGTDGFAQYLRVTRDGATGRLEITVRSPGIDEQVRIDPATGVGYVRRGPSSWETFVADERVVAFWERLLRGPLTPDLVADESRSTVRPGPVVGVEDPVGTPPSPAQAYRVGTAASELVSWAPFALGPVEGSSATNAATLVVVVALVAPGDRLVELRWAVPFGENTQVVVHRPHQVLIDADVEMPSAEEITGPATDWIILPR